MDHQLLFGTHGIRGNADKPPFTQSHLIALGEAIDLLLKRNYTSNKIIVGYDTRNSATRIKQQICSGISNDIEIFDAGVIPAPTLIMLMQRNEEFTYGIMITASHNPPTDNGIKLFARAGTDLPAEDYAALQSLFSACLEFRSKGIQHPLLTYENSWNEYKNIVSKNFAPNFLNNLRIGLDCAHGATSHYAPELFRHFGATVVTTGCSPDGSNINYECGSTHPETIKNLVLEHNLDVGFAFDGDGDRVIAVTKQGEIRDGDDILYILSTNPIYNNPTIIATHMSNNGLERACLQNKSLFLRTHVGELEVIRAMKEHNAPLGGEPSGHIIVARHLMTSDGIFAALSILDTALLTDNLDLRSFKKFPHALKNLTIAKKIPVSDPQFKEIIDHYQQHYVEARILVRYSGTEPILRIFVESSTQNTADFLVNKLSNDFSSLFSRIN